MSDANLPPTDPPDDRAERLRRVMADCTRRRARGEFLTDDEILIAHPDLMPELDRELRRLARAKTAEVVEPVPEMLEPAGQDDQGAALPSVSALDDDEAALDARAVLTGRKPGPFIPQFDGYRVVRELSRGGQAVVYQAVQTATGRMVAVKVMVQGPYATARQKARFEREVQILAALEHPNIVSIIDRGLTKNGSFFYVMEYVKGRNLDEFLDNYRSAHPNAAEDPGPLLELFARICDAVNVAHLRGVVHRDLKPSNIRIDQHENPRVLDFGLARTATMAFTDEENPRPVTVTGMFFGSLPYASPEQAEGKPSMIDPRTDVYSLGVILYRMLTGQFPYEVVGSIRDVLDNIMRAEPTPPSTVLAGKLAQEAQEHRRPRSRHRNPINSVIEAIVLKALAKRREDRYQTAGELSRDVGNYLAGKPTLAAGLPRTRRGPRIAILAAAVTLSCALTAALVWRFARPAGQAGPPQQPPHTPPPAKPSKKLPVLILADVTRAARGTAPPAPVPQRYDPAEAARRQALAARELGLDVEHEIDLGGGVKLRLVLIPSGQFTMGSPQTEKDRCGDEGPPRRVTIPGAFYMSAAEITQAQWRAVMLDEPWKGLPFAQAADTNAASYISWRDAVGFCRALSNKAPATPGLKAGMIVRLPTDAEWEYACRADSATRFHYGDDPGYAALARYAWCRTNAHDRNEKHPHPVGRKKPNAWGLYDMHGNVSEWCSDAHAGVHVSSSAAAGNAKGPPAGALRAVRGGGWDDLERLCRSACRNARDPDNRYDYVGFRVVVLVGRAE